MKGLNLERVFRLVGKWTSKNATSILTGLSLAGVSTTAVLAAKGGYNSLYSIEDAEAEKGDILTKKEMVLVVAPHYAPAIIMGLTTVGCILGLNGVHTKRSAVLAWLYSLSEASLKEYKDQILEEVGPKKFQKIGDDLAQKQLDANPVKEHDIIITGHGDTLCFDRLSGRYFKSDIELVKRAQNDFNFKLINDALVWMSVNELYYEMNLDPIGLGDDMGWDTTQLLEMRFASKLAKNGAPCLVIDYQAKPRFLYNQ